jgi:hypothetical protein
VSRYDFRRFVGIDLGGGRGKNTAVARLELTRRSDGSERLGVAEAKVRYGHRGTGGVDEPGGDALFRDEVLVEYIDRWVDDSTLVAINAPLTLPPCIRCRLPCPGVPACDVPVVEWMRDWGPRLLGRGRSDPGKPAVTPYTQRATELLWTAAGQRPRETLGQGTGPLAARAAYLRRALSPKLRLHENLLEVHPRATLSKLFGEEPERHARHGEAERVWATRKRLLGSLGEGFAFDYVWPEVVVRNTHVFYAVVSAYTGFLWARHAWSGAADLGRDDTTPIAEAARALGDLWIDDGWIFSPTEG